jgi:murein DD-endopeptidase MepM/ murein hydrolase activator NlpD
VCGDCRPVPDPGRRRVLAGLGLAGWGLGLGAAGLTTADLEILGSATARATPSGGAGDGSGSVAALRRQRAAAQRRDRELALQVRDSTADLDGTSAEVNEAVTAVTQVTADLQTARTALTSAQGQLAEATATDTRLATALASTRGRLDAARTDLARTRSGVLAHRDAVGQIARASYTHAQVPDLLGYLGSGADPDLMGAQHTVETVITGENETIAELRRLTTQEQAATVRLAGLEAETAQAKAASDAAVQQVAALTDTARAREQTLTDLLARREQVLAAAQRARSLAAAQFQLADAERSRNQVTLRRLAVAERQAVARDRARALALEKTAGGQRAALARRQAAEGAPVGTGTGAHRLAYPVIAPITSPFGMRFHPILHIWELHDGTDFGCPSGTPIHAAASGTIVSIYFNVAYGNRVIMDNGIIDGIPIATSYNHLTRAAVSVGQHVTVGQVLAISGATGWVTGPHLHFMVYENGTPVDPMTWL